MAWSGGGAAVIWVPGVPSREQLVKQLPFLGAVHQAGRHSLLGKYDVRPEDTVIQADTLVFISRRGGLRHVSHSPQGHWGAGGRVNPSSARPP